MRSIGLVIGFLVSMSLALSAQAAELFTPSYLPYAKAMPWDFAKKVEVVRVNSSALFPEGVYFEASAVEELTFQIEGITHEIFLHKAENHANGSRTWFGKVSGSPFLSHFVAEDGRVAGEIWLPMHTPGGIHWSLVARDGLQFLVQFDEDAVGKNLADKEIVPALSEKELEKLKNLVSERRRPIRHPNPCGPGEILTTTVDLMYVYDDTSLTWFGWTKPETAEAELRLLMQASEDSLNATIWNSKVEGYRVNLVAREKVKYVAAGKDGRSMSDDINWLAASPEVEALANTHKADVVGLWVGVTVNALGMAGGGYLSLNGRPYHVIMVGGGTIVAVHEFGHNLAMGHQPEDWTGAPLPFAYAHYVNLHFKTAVANWRKDLCPNFCDTVPVFANPSVLVDGIPTGIPNERENWRLVALACPVVAQYRDGSKTACFTKGGTKLAGVE